MYYLVGMLIMGEGMHVWGNGVNRKPACLPLNFVVNKIALKILCSNKFFFLIKQMSFCRCWLLYEIFKDVTTALHGDISFLNKTIM